MHTVTNGRVRVPLDLLMEVAPATHTQDITAFFPDDFPTPPEMAPFLRPYAELLISFIIHDGDPILLKQIGGNNTSVWLPFSPGGSQAKFTVVGLKVLGSDDSGREERCTFWRSLGSLIPY